MGQVHIESLGEGIVWLAPEMPFAEMPCLVACGLESLGQREVLEVQSADAAGHQRGVIRSPARLE